MESVVFIAGQRTPFGAFGGSLKGVSATELSVMAAQGTLNQIQFSKEQIDHVIVGNVVQSGSDAAYLPRHVGLKLGLPQSTGAYLVNRLCGSGFQSWINGAQMLLLGEAQAVLAGGVEQMSQVPYVARNVRWGNKMGSMELEDYMTAALTDAHVQLPMAMTAENLAEKYGISKEESDLYSYQSQMRFKKAEEAGVFKSEITPVVLQDKKGSLTIDKDEHPRRDAEIEKIRAMKPLFKKEGVVTAASASGIVDGAAFSLLTTATQAQKWGVKPLAKVLGWSAVGCDPKIMGIGPVAAIQSVLKKLNMNLNQMDIVEVNEAFAAQYLAVQKELQLDSARTNMNGGAIAVGHPLGASGTRIMNHLVYELHRQNKKYAVGSACIGGGQGIAVVIERF
ncbi:MAG TPA: acetyl-CoA C-acyltransferase [Pseudobdellovibrionaceae bacterium]|nr:acetyl-CoA C-acyltransferase [Pseudobdellovibrionaceae bacterium]